MTTRLRTTLVALGLLAAGMAQALAAPNDGWRTVFPRGSVVGPDGLPHTASCSGFPGTNPRFKFWVRPGDPQKLAVLFDGGGACWDKLSCSHPFSDGPRDKLLQFYSADIPRGQHPSQYGGILDLANPANPVRDWTVVVVPYCTGDVHLGSVDREYQRPATGKPFTIRHRGYDNFMVVYDWISRNVLDAKQLFVTGGSAGGYGAASHFPWLAQRYPTAALSVLADASQGVSTQGFDTGTPGRGSWNMQLPPWVFGSDPLAMPTADLLHRGALAYPQARLAQYTNVADEVQTGFYGYMKAAYGPGGSCPNLSADWNQQMLDKLAVYEAQLPNFRSFLTPGGGHTILASSSFYAPSPAGPVFADWLRGMLDHSPGAPAWDAAACPDCKTPLPCPPLR